MTEVWSPIPDYVGRYEASSMGRIRSLDMKCGAVNGGYALRKGRVLVTMRKRNGYRAVSLTGREGKVQRLVHSLVAAAFLGPRPDGAQVCHWNNDKTDNRLENLRYATPCENMMDRDRHATTRRGATHGMAKLDVAAVKAIRRSAASSTELAERYGVTACTIWSVRTRRSWRHI